MTSQVRLPETTRTRRSRFLPDKAAFFLYSSAAGGYTELFRTHRFYGCGSELIDNEK